MLALDSNLPGHPVHPSNDFCEFQAKFDALIGYRQSFNLLDLFFSEQVLEFQKQAGLTSVFANIRLGHLS